MFHFRYFYGTLLLVNISVLYRDRQTDQQTTVRITKLATERRFLELSETCLYMVHSGLGPFSGSFKNCWNMISDPKGTLLYNIYITEKLHYHLRSLLSHFIYILLCIPFSQTNDLFIGIWKHFHYIIKYIHKTLFSDNFKKFR